MTKLRVLVVIVVLILADCEEWFEPDSHLISEAEHAEKIRDPTTFKFVKYFTPNCMYCRYLKMVVDKIKHEKEWCFTMYDFNCQWYPQFCFQTIRAGAFPHTIVYNPEGAVDEVISGFYPEPVMRTIFDKL
jgi:thioredoxin-related protein